MEAFEHRDITTALKPPRILKSYFDDTFVIQHQTHKEENFKHINTVDPLIQFTMEEAAPNGSIPFLDILITLQTAGTFTTRIYRKLTHTLTYAINGIVTTTLHPSTVWSRPSHTGPKPICSTPQLFTSEFQHLEKVLMQCKYPKWAINKVLQKQQDHQKKTSSERQISSDLLTEKKSYIVVLYSQGICESFKTICR